MNIYIYTVVGAVSLLPHLWPLCNVPYERVMYHLDKKDIRTRCTDAELLLVFVTTHMKELDTTLEQNIRKCSNVFLSPCSILRKIGDHLEHSCKGTSKVLIMYTPLRLCSVCVRESHVLRVFF